MSSNKASEEIIQKVKKYALERRSELLNRNVILEQQLNEYKNYVNVLPNNHPEKNMWLLLAKNCFEVKRKADGIIKGIDSIIKAMDNAKDALSMMDIKNILLSLRPDENSKRINKDFGMKYNKMNELIGESQEANNELFGTTEDDDGEFAAFMNDLGGGASQQQQSVDYYSYIQSADIQPLGANAYGGAYQYQPPPQTSSQLQPDFDY